MIGTEILPVPIVWEKRDKLLEYDRTSTDFRNTALRL